MTDYTTVTPNTTTFTTQAPADNYFVEDYIVSGYFGDAGSEQWTVKSVETTTWL